MEGHDHRGSRDAAHPRTRDGYIFLGWRRKAPTARTTGVTGSYTATKSITLYAVWQQDVPPAQTYTVVCVVSNGSAAVSANKAAQGEVVSVINLTPNSGYELGSITYQPEGGRAVDITATESFMMPAANVTVTVTFTKTETPPPADLFTDVADSSLCFYEARLLGRDNGITTGKTATTFAPYESAPVRRSSPSSGA